MAIKVSRRLQVTLVFGLIYGVICFLGLSFYQLKYDKTKAEVDRVVEITDQCQRLTL